jgi:hypothetical protein
MPSYLPSADEEFEYKGKRYKPVQASGTSFKRTEIVTNTEAQRLVGTTNRKLAEMPAMPKHMNSISIVLVYTASGLTDQEIAIATGFSVTQIRGMRENTAYKEIERYMVEAAKQQSENEVKQILADAAVNAATRVSKLVDSVDEKVALRASQDLLDRNGHKAAEKIDLRQEMLNTFRIEVVERRTPAIPTIDGEAEEVV